MLWSQMPVMLLGACTSCPGSGAGVGVVCVGVVVARGGGVGELLVRKGEFVVGEGDEVAPGVVVETAVASSAGQPYREASDVARSPPA